MHNHISVSTMIQLPTGGVFQIVGVIFHHGPTPSSGRPAQRDKFYVKSKLISTFWVDITIKFSKAAKYEFMRNLWENQQFV